MLPNERMIWNQSLWFKEGFYKGAINKAIALDREEDRKEAEKKLKRIQEQIRKEELKKGK